MDGAFCHLSGVENQCRRMLDEGAKKEDVALFCLLSIQTALCHMTDTLQKQYGKLPIVYAGGVMSNSILRKHLSEAFGGQFAPPVYAADNAAGIAVLCKIREEE
jgi:N6-L-threonylcarbamoyladenine synthase